jgi:hypothetical protein
LVSVEIIIVIKKMLSETVKTSMLELGGKNGYSTYKCCGKCNRRVA